MNKPITWRQFIWFSCSIFAAIYFYRITNPTKQTTTWLGSPIYSIPGATNNTVQRKDDVIVGLQQDGIMVWRKLR